MALKLYTIYTTDLTHYNITSLVIIVDVIAITASIVMIWTFAQNAFNITSNKNNKNGVEKKINKKTLTRIVFTLFPGSKIISITNSVEYLGDSL